MIQFAPIESTSERHSIEKVIVTEATNRLRQSNYPALRSLTCESSRGVLTIHGEVPSFYLKQMAQTILGTLQGCEINNLVRVVRSGRFTGLENPFRR